MTSFFAVEAILWSVMLSNMFLRPEYDTVN